MMDPGDTDWSRWSAQSDMDSGLDIVKNDDSVLSSEPRSDNLGDGSNLGADDDYMANYALYDGYDSYNEASDSSDDGDDYEQEMLQEVPVYTPPLEQKTEYRFMNGKDGMATCEMCGAIGIKHAFYSKSKRFCSLACSRGFAAAQKEGKLSMQHRVQMKLEPGIKMKTKYPKQTAAGSITVLNTGGISKQGTGKNFDWAQYLSATHAQAAAVSCFTHCPMSDCWENITVGMKVEVINHDCDLPSNVFWIATVIKIAGYMALMRYEGYGNDQSNDFWINLCTQDVHPVGWCATIGKPLVPPQTIQHKYSDWKDFLVRRLTGARTLPNNFYNRVIESINNHNFKHGVKVEVVDKMCVSAMRVAVVDEVFGGRLRLQYRDRTEENDDFWCHMRSSLLHPVGWAQQVGHKLHASQEYKNQSLGKSTMQKYDPDDATPEWFKPVIISYHTADYRPFTTCAGLRNIVDCVYVIYTVLKDSLNDMKFQVGMKLEAIDPLNLSTICVATVMKVLRDNYLMIGIDGSMAMPGSDWFCYHSASPCIFPAGFCEINGLDLTPPKGYKGPFKWFDYLKQTKASAAPVKLFDKEIPKHGFKSTMKVEAVDLMEPRLICVGTVVKVVGRLLKIHFDGWESEYDQWVDCETPDIYPVGWCEIMGYNLEGPRVRETTEHYNALLTEPSGPGQTHHNIPKKRKGKTQIYRGPRKKRKPKGAPPVCKPVKVLSDKTNQRSTHPLYNSPQFQISPETVSAALPPLMDHSNLKIGEITQSSHASNAGKLQVNLEDEGPGTDAPPALSPQSPAMGHNNGMNGRMPELDGSLSQRSPEVTRALILKPIDKFLNRGMGKPSVQSALVTASIVPTAGAPTLSVVTTSSGVKLKTTGSLAVVSSLAAQLQSSTSPRPLHVGTERPILTPITVSQAHIPRIIPVEDDKGTASSSTPSSGKGADKERIVPELWSVFDVCQFLRTNDCGAYCDSFSKKSIDGNKFLSLTKEQIVNLTGMKVGPSLKIYDLIQQLKVRVSQQDKPIVASSLI